MLAVKLEQALPKNHRKFQDAMTNRIGGFRHEETDYEMKQQIDVFGISINAEGALATEMKDLDPRYLRTDCALCLEEPSWNDRKARKLTNALLYCGKCTEKIVEHLEQNPPPPPLPPFDLSSFPVGTKRAPFVIPTFIE